MTAFNALFSKDSVIIATDTIAHFVKRQGDNEMRPSKFVSKTHYLPAFKSMFAVTGVSEFGQSFWDFMTFRAYGFDIDSIMSIDLSHFKEKWESDLAKFNEFNDLSIITKITSTLYLFGFSNAIKEFKGFKLVYNKEEMKWHEFIDGPVIVKPQPINTDNISKFGEPSNPYEYLVNIMRLQKEEDENKLFENQVGIGGHVQISHLHLLNDAGDIIYNTFNAFKFEDYDDTKRRILINQNT